MILDLNMRKDEIRESEWDLGEEIGRNGRVSLGLEKLATKLYG